MWICQECKRVFEKDKQPHSCKSTSFGDHFIKRGKAKEIFDSLLREINGKIGKCQIISLPCCIHLFGKYDFLAVLPRKDRLEIRFALDRALDSSRLKKSVPLSLRDIKNCIDVREVTEIDRELIGWLKEAYHLRERVAKEIH